MLAGFLMGLGLIVPIGAQNAFVLKLGLLRQHVLPVVLLCASMDAVLIFLGVSFAGATFAQYTWALTAIRYVGVSFLLFYGARAFLNAFRHAQPSTQSPLLQHVSFRTAVLTCLGFTLLNPHVYLDTFVLIGGLSVQYQPHQFYFALGAASASFIWFLTLGFGARFSESFICQKPHMACFRSIDWHHHVEHRL
ncbi:L-lysine exporter family protein LysE/ArgO [Hydromonas duriensis]|uniref:L-lysine exporter family protein LysE/ArgO n=2 Tax=Hydromonas duriensis TaxID=1527608 RepID=A0A4R6Y8D6_9BURK|nr:L-lysine exporter family protein LysE/ArgO [Hydromonas duriensis]